MPFEFASAPAFIFREQEFRYPDRGGYKYRPSFSQTGARLPVTYEVLWEERFNAKAVLLGGPTFVNIPLQMFGYVSRDLPHAHPEGEGYLWCKQVDTEPSEAESPPDPNGPDFPNAKTAYLHCQYEMFDYDHLEDTDIMVAGVVDESTLLRYVSMPPRKSKNRQMPVRGGIWEWAAGTPSAGRRLTEPSFVNLTDSERTYIWRQVPYANIPIGTIEATLNSSNALAFDGIAVGEAIFKDYSISEPYRAPNWTWCGDVTYTIFRAAMGANKLPDGSAGWRFYDVHAPGDPTRPPYPPLTWEPLFRPIVPP